MKVAITSNTLEYGGAERQRVVLANELVKLGHSVRFIALQSGGPLDSLLNPEISVSIGRGSIPWRRGLRNSDVLITGTTNTETLFGLLAVKSQFGKCRWLAAAHNPVVKGFATYPLPAKVLLKSADAQICLSKNQRDILVEEDGFELTKTAIIPNGIDVARFLAVPKCLPRSEVEAPLRLGFIGRLVEQKGLDVLLSALLDLPKSTWTLDVHGEGPLYVLQNDTRFRAIQANINWHGSSASDEALADVDVLVVPSRNEAFPLVLLEAMIAGRPVIATSVGSIPEIASPGVVLTEPLHTGALSDSIRSLFDPRRLNQLTEAAEQFRVDAADLYSSSRMAESYVSLFEESLESQPRPATRPPTRVLQIGSSRSLPGGIAQVIGDYERVIESHGLTAEYLPTSWTGGNFRDLIATLRVMVRLVRRAAGRDAVVLHAHLSQGGSFLREGSCIVVASILGLQTIASLHGSRFGAFAEKRQSLVKFVLRRADSILVLTPEASRILDNLGLSERTFKISNWTDGAFGEPTPNPEAMRVVFAGEVGYRKGVDTLLTAWRDVIARIPDAHLQLIGPVPDPAAITGAQSFGSTQLSVAGALPHDDVIEAIRRSDLVVLPSRGEAMPKVLVEAFALGRPVVATRVGAVSEMIEPDYGRIVDPGDPAGLSQALIEVLSDSSFKRSATVHAYARYEKSFSAAAVAPFLLSFYESNRGCTRFWAGIP